MNLIAWNHARKLANAQEKLAYWNGMYEAFKVIVRSTHCHNDELQLAEAFANACKYKARVRHLTEKILQ